MTKVILNGKAVDYETMVQYMDDELREELHVKLAPCTEQEFADAYVEAHWKKFGEEFVIN